MKHKLVLVLFLVIFIGLVAPSPAASYTGISGRVIDSKTLTAWLNGADVWIVNNSQGGAIIATGALSLVDGSFSLTWGTDGLNYASVGSLGAPPSAGDQVEVIIDFTCGFRAAGNPGVPAPPATCPPINGTPATIGISIGQNSIPIIYSVGTNLETGTGPTSVQLVDFSVSQPATQNPWLPYVLLVGSVVLVTGAVTILRKRRVS